VRIVVCEPENIPGEDELEMSLSASVSAAIDPAVAIVESLVRDSWGASDA
jgi:hypothetical protein